MSERAQRTWTIPTLPEAHLGLDVVVAFVDGELSMTAHERAATHIARCPMCAAETAEQRQARAAVRGAEAPRMPASLLATLCAIPSSSPDLDDTHHGDLAMSPDGQLMAVQRPDRAFGGGPMLGSSTPLGGGNVLRTGAQHGRRAVQGAGVVAAGLMLGALAMVGPHVLNASGQRPAGPVHGEGATVSDQGDVVQANFAAPMGGTLPEAVSAPAPHTSRFAHVQAR